MKTHRKSQRQKGEACKEGKVQGTRNTTLQYPGRKTKLYGANQDREAAAECQKFEGLRTP